MNNMILAELVGTVATLIGCFTQVPQIIHVIRTKDQRCLSKLSYIMAGVSTFLYLVLGIVTGLVSLMIGNFLRVIQIIVMIYLIYKYRKEQGE